MSKAAKDKEQVLRYLFGEMTVDEQQEFEARYFVDDALLDELEIVRAELLDGWVRGELTPAEKTKLASRLRQLPALRTQTEFAQNLQQALDKLAAPPAPTQAARFRTVGSRLAVRSGQGQLKWLAASLGLLLLIGLWWFYSGANRSPVSLEKTQANLPPVSPVGTRPSAPTVLPPDRAAQPAPPPNSQKGRKARGLPAVVTGTLVSFALSADLVRDLDEPVTLAIPASARAVQLQLELTEPAGPLLHAELQTAAGETVWQQTGLRPQKSRQLSFVVCRLPAAQLKNEVYRLRLLAPDQTVVTEYLFRSQSQ